MDVFIVVAQRIHLEEIRAGIPIAQPLIGTSVAEGASNNENLARKQSIKNRVSFWETCLVKIDSALVGRQLFV